MYPSLQLFYIESMFTIFPCRFFFFFHARVAINILCVESIECESINTFMNIFLSDVRKKINHLFTCVLLCLAIPALIHPLMAFPVLVKRVHD